MQIRKVAFRYKYLFAILFLSIFSAFVVTFVRRQVYVNRASPERTASIDADSSIEQAIWIQNSNSLSFTVLANCKNKDATLVAKFLQPNREAIHEIPMRKIKQRSWEYVSLELNGLHNGEALLVLEGSNFGAEDRIEVILTSGTDIFNLPAASVNGVKQDGLRLNLWYDIFDGKLFATSLILFLFIYGAGFLLIRRCGIKILKENKLVLLGIGLVIIQCINSHIFKQPVNKWIATDYFLTYKYGFIADSFAGTCLWALAKLLTGKSFISASFFHNYSIALFFAFMLLLFFFLQRVIHNTSNSASAKMAGALILLYLCSPFSPQYYARLLGKTDMLCGICFILCCIFIFYEKFLFTIPLWIFIGISIQRMFAFTYFPLILVALLYLGTTKSNKKFLRLFWATALVGINLAAYYQHYQWFRIAGLKFHEIAAQMQERTDIPLLLYTLEFKSEAVLTTPLFWNRFRAEYFNFNIPLHVILNILLLSPIFILFIGTWRNSLKNAKTTAAKISSIAFMFAPLIPFLFERPFRNFDWGGYLMALSTGLIFCMLLFLAKKDSLLSQAAERTQRVFSARFGGFAFVTLALFYAHTGGTTELITGLSNNLSQTITTNAKEELESLSAKMSSQREYTLELSDGELK